MSILQELSSQRGDRTQRSNEQVALQCREQPMLLEDIGFGLTQQDAKLVGDCAEVMTLVAQHQPDLVIPYADALITLLTHRTTRVRWEAMHAVALIANLIPNHAPSLKPILVRAIQHDTSIIVRDYAVDALGCLATANGALARAIYPVLIEALHLWDGRQAKQALMGLCNVLSQEPSLAGNFLKVGQQFSDHPKRSVKEAAKKLTKACLSV